MKFQGHCNRTLNSHSHFTSSDEYKFTKKRRKCEKIEVEKN